PRKLLDRLVRVPAGLAPRRRLRRISRVAEPPWRDPPDEGGTPVREPRRPKPNPISGSGAKPIPDSSERVLSKPAAFMSSRRWLISLSVAFTRGSRTGPAALPLDAKHVVPT